MNIGIVGLGLIGGSLGLDFRAVGHHVIGVGRKAETCQLALDLGIADHAGTTFDLLSDVDVVFLCTPLGSMETIAQVLIPYLKSTAILTDVGSVKASIVKTLEPLWPHFIGGHPMAGKAVAGLQEAQPQLFAQRPYVLTPTAATTPNAQAVLVQLISDLHSTYYECSPTQHDRAVAWISHLPVMVSASLIAACQQEPETATLALAQTLASSGFCDTSRVGGGNPELGRMMAQYNRDELLRSLHTYRHALDDLTRRIEQCDWDAIETILTTTQNARQHFLI